MLDKLKSLAKKKSIIGLVAVVAVTGTVAETQFNKPPQPTKYVLGQVTRGTIVQTVSGSGQVAGVNQLDITPTVSGEVTKVLVKAGDKITAGTPMFAIDNSDAVKAVRDAQQSVRDASLSYQSAQLSYQQFIAPAKTVDVEKAQNTLDQAKRDLADLQDGADPIDIKQAQADLDAAKDDAQVSSDGVTPKLLRNAYDDAVPQIKSIAQDLRQDLYDADSVLGMDNVSANDSFESLLSVLDSSHLAQAQADYASAKEKILDLKSAADALANTNEDPAKVDATMKIASDALNAAEPLLQQTYEALLSTLTSTSFSEGSLSSLQGKIQSDHSGVSSKLSTINNLKESIDNAKTSAANADRNVAKAQDALDKLVKGADPVDIAIAKTKVNDAAQTLADLKAGPTAIDIAVQKNSLSQRASSLQTAIDHLNDAQKTLADYSVKAPFDGVVANVAAKESSQASASTKLATLLTDAKMVTISLNEVDIAKLAVGQKATITFDALPDLSIAGAVTEVDTIGTVSQGVVTYNVQITFQTNDDRVKPGMSASVSVATDVQTDVLTVPSSAVKNGSVQTLPDMKTPSAEAQSTGIADAKGPMSVPVETGASSDQSIEIKSGLNEGDWIIIRTIVPTTASASKTSTGNSLIPGGAGGAVRIQTGGGNFGGGAAGRTRVGG